MSKKEIEINACELMCSDFENVLNGSLILPARQMLEDASRICYQGKYDAGRIEELKDLLHNAYCMIEHAHELVRGFNEIDLIINKKGKKDHEELDKILEGH